MAIRTTQGIRVRLIARDGVALRSILGSARRTILGQRPSAVVNDAHTLYLIVDSPDQESVRRFMQPFAQVGTIEILRTSSCEAVVSRGGCDASER